MGSALASVWTITSFKLLETSWFWYSTFWVQKYHVDSLHTANSTYLFGLRELFGKFILYVYFLKLNNIRTKTLGNLIAHQGTENRI